MNVAHYLGLTPRRVDGTAVGGCSFESDEIFYGRKDEGTTDPWYFENETARWRKKRLAYANMIPVGILVERGGKARSVKVENVTAREVRRVIRRTPTLPAISAPIRRTCTARSVVGSPAMKQLITARRRAHANR